MELDLNDRYANDTRSGEPENVLAGAVGAFLFALAGGAAWVLLDKAGFVAGISGLIGVVCAVKGYSIFAKKESMKGIIISVIMALLVMVIAWYACFAWDVHDAFKEWYKEGEVDSVPTYFECFRNGYVFFEEKEIAGEYFVNLGIGLLLCIVASVSFIINQSKKIKAQQAAGNADPFALQQELNMQELNMQDAPSAQQNDDQWQSGGNAGNAGL